MLLNHFTHIKGKPHPAQRRTASPAPCWSSKAARTPPSKQAQPSPVQQKDTPVPLCDTVCKEGGKPHPEQPQGASQERREMLRKPAASQQKFGFFFPGLSAARADPPLPRDQGEVAAAVLLSHPHASSDGNGNWQPSRSPRPEAVSSPQRLRRRFSTTSVTAFVHPALQQTRAFLAFRVLKEWGGAGRKRTESLSA